MASDGKPTRSVVTDFGATPQQPARASGKQASREKRADSEQRAASQGQPSRTTTTEAPPAVSGPPLVTETMRMPQLTKLPGAVAAGAHYAPGFDQSQLHAREAERSQAPMPLQVSEELLRTKDPRLHLINAPDGEAAAALRILRHQIEAAGKPQVIAISSPNDGEGKTETAVNLALALSECGRASVLLLEANTRRPAISRMFNFSPQACFAEQVERYHSAPGSPWHVTYLPACHLHMMPLARGRTPAPLLDGPAFRYALDGLRAVAFDHIIIDCCSVLAGADVNLVQDAADAVLMVARARETTGRDMRSAVERLTPSRLIGTVLLGP